jgi:tetratricopeptide (TPR) repeat protein
MVGRVELLTAERERRAEAAILNLASTDAASREQAFAALREEGRYVEPIVRRTLRTSTDARVQMLCRRLLLTDFVTELRTSLTHAASGDKLPQNPIYARAQLASLLREIGLTAEAKQEGERALALLQAMPQPTMSDHNSRHMFRALARANEGAGRDTEALRWYGDFVRFGSQSTTCSGCHETEGPRTMAFYRDWWAGNKFGAYAVKTGEASQLIAAHEAALAQAPGSPAAQLSLAYLYEARGDATRAKEMWRRLVGG